MRQRSVVTIFACLALALLLATGAYAQDQPNTPGQRNPSNPPPTSPQTSPPATRQPTPSTRTETPTTKDTSSGSFLSQAIEINQAEVELGRLAASKGMDKRVKDFGNMMVKDHTAGLEKLQKLPGGSGTAKLNSEHEQLKTKLSGLSGAEFDREYIDAMVSGHREAVSLFEHETGSSTTTNSTQNKAGTPKNSSDNSGVSKGSSDNQVNDAARSMLPTIKQHLSKAEDIQKSLTKPAK